MSWRSRSWDCFVAKAVEQRILAQIQLPQRTLRHRAAQFEFRSWDRYNHLSIRVDAYNELHLLEHFKAEVKLAKVIGLLTRYQVSAAEQGHRYVTHSISRCRDV